MAIQDELAMYLSTGHDLQVKDGLCWWYEHKHLYPNLSCMAMNYLSIPGTSVPFLVSLLLMHIIATSVDVERTFSQGRLVLHMCVTDYQFSRPVLFCVLGCGV